MRRIVAATAIVVAAAAPGCSKDDPKPDIELDGSFREPDVSGLVDDVDLERITVDGDERELSENLIAFSTYTLAALPVVETRGAYVHIGTKDDTVVWLAVVGRPVGSNGDQVILYNGTVKSSGEDVVRFVDGTVLRLARGLEAPPAGVRALAQIDPDDDLVRQIDGE